MLLEYENAKLNCKKKNSLKKRHKLQILLIK